ncbi:hypothetical protein Pan97_35710 [Bremerella volcania]|uniref:Uncharacterized protein n=1 Tax=Bremerella volcania TaxID=2527984 RepID=A0A518CBD3_9BACT|nr:hypothetical protein [Bremerella volcania]QDU76520.1 hypothetical protein Pan97_35710 [Bremerella volcania]
MSEERGLLRGISWHECFPWLILFRATLIGFYLRVLLLAYLGVCLLSLGHWIGLHLFGSWVNDGAGPVLASSPTHFLQIVREGLEGENPFQVIFPTPTFGGLLVFLFFSLWYITTFAIFGGAISRIAAMEFSVNDRCGLKGALGHSLRKFISYFLSPIFPMIGVTMLMVILLVFGLINWLGPWAAVVTGIFGFIAVLVSLGIGMLVVPLILGWPLMWGAISTECSDHFDALSRCYAYVTQRPFHYLWYLLVAFVGGSVGFFAMSLLVGTSLAALSTGLQWGQGLEQTEVILTHSVSGPVWRFWYGVVQLLIPAYSFGYFFAVFSGIYLLLRRDVDQAEMDEIVLDEDQPRFAMPALNKDLGGDDPKPDGDSSEDDDS